MQPLQFIKKYNLKEKDVPRLYNIYLDIMAKKEITQALNLTTIINLLDKKQLINR